MANLEIYTDGGSRGNPGIGGWGLYCPQLNYESYGYKEVATNNEMELTAILKALKWVINKGFTEYDNIIIYSDSSYCVNIFNQWVWTWLKQGILETKKNPVLIKDILLLRRLLKSDGWGIKFVKVPGHSDNEGNNHADRLVNYAMDEKSSSIYLNDFKNISYYLTLLPYVESVYLDKDNNLHVCAPGYTHDKSGLSSHGDGLMLGSIFNINIEWSGSRLDGGIKLW